jgi:hypothetical protein
MKYIGKEISKGVISYPGLTYNQYMNLLKIIPGYSSLSNKEKFKTIKREYEKGTIDA